MIGETVTFIKRTPQEFDANDDPIASTPVEIHVRHCVVAPRFSQDAGSGEVAGRGRNGIVIGFTIYAPAGTIVGRDDKAIVRGVECDVDGEPAVWDNPYGGTERGVEISVRYGEG